MVGKCKLVLRIRVGYKDHQMTLKVQSINISTGGSASLRLGHKNFNPSCTKVFGTHTFYEGGGGGLSRPPMISKTADSTNFNFGRPLELYMRGRKLVKLMI